MTDLIRCSDRDLLDLLQRSRVEGFDELYERHHRLALAVAFRVLADRDHAEEVVQESFLAVWRRSATYRADRGGVRGWILSIVRHRAIDQIRRARSAAPLATLDESLPDPGAADVFSDANREVERMRIVDAVASLPTEQREALELAYYGGLTQHEIAEHVGIPLGTVKGRVRLAMDKLRTALADLGIEEGEVS